MIDNSSLYLLSFVAGIFLAAQSSVSAQIGTITNNPVFASSIAFAICLFLATTYLLFSKQGYPPFKTMSKIPLYLWFLSGTLSFSALIAYFVAIPKIGISSVITLGLTGQLLFSILASHYGLFDSPVQKLTLQKVFGALFMIVGLVLVNFKIKF